MSVYLSDDENAIKSTNYLSSVFLNFLIKKFYCIKRGISIYKNADFLVVKTREILIRWYYMAKYSRWGKSLIESALMHRRVVILAGPRQCGKTTLAKEFVLEGRIYRTLDDVSMLESAQADPQGFVEHDSELMVIDEVQRAPLLLSSIKKVVDEDTRPGQFLLTGSANIQSMPSVTESLAGRVRKIRLRPLAQGEINGNAPSFFQDAFSGSFKNEYPEFSRAEIIRLAFKGGFPEAIRFDERERALWHQDYLQSLLERDLKDILNIRRSGAMQELLPILAAWSSKFMDISSITAHLGIKRPTIESYINALEALYLVEKLQPWTHTDYDRVGKNPKFFMTDSGLMASCLKWIPEKIVFDSDKIGKLVETFVFNQLSAQIDLNNDLFSIYHYRDRERREIDFLVEHADGSILGIEVKASSTVSLNDFKHMKWFQANLAKDRPFIGVVLYSGSTVLPFGKNFFALPMGALL